MKILHAILLVCLLLSACDAKQAEAPANQPKQKSKQELQQEPKHDLLGYWVQHYTVKGEFSDVESFLKLAIEDRGIKINNVSHIGEMLQRTSAEVGDTTVLYKNALAYEFCSATLSRHMMKSDPHFIALCPYIIYIYELPQEPGTIHLSYRNPLPIAPADKSLQAVDQLLRDIIKDLQE